MVTRSSRPRTALDRLLSLWPLLGSGSLSLSSRYVPIHAFRNDKLLTFTYAANGEKGIVEPTFVYLPGVEGGEEVRKVTGVDFFAVPVELGPNGATRVHNSLSNITDAEKKLLEVAITGLKGNIDKGVEFVATAEAAKL